MLRLTSVPGHLFNQFIPSELDQAISSRKNGKAPGLDHILPEFFQHSGTTFRHMAKILSLPNTKICKPSDKTVSYRQVSLLSVEYKLRDHLILLRINPVIDLQLSRYQYGFRLGISTT
ncbi:hypothetical protein GJ496_010986 [Pomphorhynchus laevis]|nr:hypothetical protein GJ496_010986 [Pomphorhynchus laevis]